MLKQPKFITLRVAPYKGWFWYTNYEGEYATSGFLYMN